jgi:long-chain acyl-CoA synthetase
MAQQAFEECESAPEAHPRLAANATLIDLFNRMANLPGEAVLYDDGYRHWRYSYADMVRAARAFAARLDEKSVGKGDTLLFWSENRPEWLAAFWGCALRGVIVVPVDYHASAETLRRIWQVVHASAVLFGEQVEASTLGEEIPTWSLTSLDFARSAYRKRAVQISSPDVAEIVFTSGTSAVPKGVTITHRNITADLAPLDREIQRYRAVVRLLHPIRFLSLLPLSHMFGQAVAAFVAPMMGGTVVFMNGYAPHEVISQIRRRHVSFLVAVPKMLAVLRQYVVAKASELRSVEPDNSRWIVRRWRYRKIHRLFGPKFFGFVVGGAPLESGLEQFWSQLGFLVVQGYGLTETAPIVSFNHPFYLKPGTVGKPLPWVDVRIGRDNEILVRGDIVTPGYYSAPAEAHKAFEDGWFHTGDVGAIDQEGYLTVRGRIDEMIVTPEGLKVFPEDVELVLNRISGVRDSAVVGRQRVHAVLVLEQGADKEEIVREANALLENHQKIRTASVWAAGALPRTEGTGKLKRAAIQRFVDEGLSPLALKMSDGIEALIQKYVPGRTVTPEMSLEQIGLSSLDQVELMIELEQRFNVTIDETVVRSGSVFDLAKSISRGKPIEEPLVFAEWPRRLPARFIRHSMLAAVILPIISVCARPRADGLHYLHSLQGPVIFASNHQSHLDTPVIMHALPGPWRYRLAVPMWKEFFDAHFYPERHSHLQRLTSTANYYSAMLFFNAFPLSQQEHGLRESIRHIGELVSEGWSVLIFPEGERSMTREIGHFQAGVGIAASRLRVPVVPVRLKGVDRVLHRGSRMIHPGSVEVVFGSPLELKGDDHVELAGRVETAVRAL